MEKYKIKLNVCNKDLQVSVTAENEEEYRLAAKQANNVYNFYKEHYQDAADDYLMAFLFLIMTMRAIKADAALPETKKKSQWKRFIEFLNKITQPESDEYYECK